MIFVVVVERRRPRPFRLSSVSSRSISPSLSCCWTKNGANGVPVGMSNRIDLFPASTVSEWRSIRVCCFIWLLSFPPPPETLYFLVFRIQQYGVFETFMSIEPSYENARLCTSPWGRLYTDMIMRPLNLVASPAKTGLRIGVGLHEVFRLRKVGITEPALHKTEPRSRHP